jgi:hypothetical protein
MALLAAAVFCSPGAIPRQTNTSGASENTTPDPLFRQVIANQEQSETELDQYERIERQESHALAAKSDAGDGKAWRVFPTGPGADKIPVTPEGKPTSPESYRSDLEKLEKYLAWVIENGSDQKREYAKAERRRKERFELLEATYHAFIFTPDGEEIRQGRKLARYSLKPNPSYKPPSMKATVFKKVEGTIWVDEESSQLAKIEGTVIEDISLGLFVAKVYKGSHFMQERYEVAPGVWEPTFEQYDFDGRRFLSPVSIHERTFYSGYKRVGPPGKAIEVVRAELGKLKAEEASE